MGRGGQMGSGVGTWADENAQWDGKWTDHWDNTGVVRPDTTRAVTPTGVREN